MILVCVSNDNLKPDYIAFEITLTVVLFNSHVSISQIKYENQQNISQWKKVLTTSQPKNVGRKFG